MSKEYIQKTTIAAIRAWADSETRESYASWLAVQKKAGKWWAAQDSI